MATMSVDLTTELSALLVRAHHRAAVSNPNLSSTALIQAAQAGQPFTQCVQAAIATLGELHGPVVQARALIYKSTDWREFGKGGMFWNRRCPGWGHGLYRDQVDPAFHAVAAFIGDHYPEHHERLEAVTGALESALGRKLYPNAAAFTAVVAEILSVPRGTEVALFLQGRLAAWSDLWAAAHREGVWRA